MVAICRLWRDAVRNSSRKTPLRQYGLCGGALARDLCARSRTGAQLQQSSRILRAHCFGLHSSRLRNLYSSKDIGSRARGIRARASRGWCPTNRSSRPPNCCAVGRRLSFSVRRHLRCRIQAIRFDYRLPRTAIDPDTRTDHDEHCKEHNLPLVR